VAGTGAAVGRNRVYVAMFVHERRTTTETKVTFLLTLDPSDLAYWFVCLSKWI
jgi:hypothetical protein